MEKDLFPSRNADGESTRDLPPVSPATMPRMSLEPHGDSCSCGNIGCQNHVHGNDNGACNMGCTGYEGCGDTSWGLSEYPLAMVYAPCQIFRALYDPATALSRGTLFTELDLPLGDADGGAFTTDGCSYRTERRRV